MDESLLSSPSGCRLVQEYVGYGMNEIQVISALKASNGVIEDARAILDEKVAERCKANNSNSQQPGEPGAGPSIVDPPDQNPPCPLRQPNFNETVDDNAILPATVPLSEVALHENAILPATVPLSQGIVLEDSVILLPTVLLPSENAFGEESVMLAETLAMTEPMDEDEVFGDGDDGRIYELDFSVNNNLLDAFHSQLLSYQQGQDRNRNLQDEPVFEIVMLYLLAISTAQIDFRPRSTNNSARVEADVHSRVDFRFNDICPGEDWHTDQNTAASTSNIGCNFNVYYPDGKLSHTRKADHIFPARRRPNLSNGKLATKPDTVVGEIKFKKKNERLSADEERQYEDYMNYLSMGGTKCVVYWIARYETTRRFAHVSINSWSVTDFKLRFYSKHDHESCRAWLADKGIPFGTGSFCVS